MFRILGVVLLLSFLYKDAALGHPLLSEWLRKMSASASVSESGWLWGWSLGGDGTVSIVDRSPPVTFTSRPASFGQLLDDPLMGYVIPMSSFTVPCPNCTTETLSRAPNLGCPTLCVSGRHEPERTESWIALVQRGECQFVKKVREAQRFGAKGVIVGGDDPEEGGNPDTLVSMYSPGDSSDVTIPATFIKYSDYIQLSSLITASNTSTSGIRTLSIQVAADYSSWEWYSPLLTFVVLLLLPSSLTLVTLLIHRVRAARAARRDRAPEDIVNSLPWRIWTRRGWEKHEAANPLETEEPSSTNRQTSVDLEQGGAVQTSRMANDEGDPSTSSEELAEQPWFEAQTECAICLAEFVNGDRVRVLPCKHIFHLEEVDEWLIHRKKLCPVCKADVTHPSPPSRPHRPQSDVSPHSQQIPIASPDVTERTPLLNHEPPHHTNESRPRG